MKLFSRFNRIRVKVEGRGVKNEWKRLYKMWKSECREKGSRHDGNGSIENVGRSK